MNRTEQTLDILRNCTRIETLDTSKWAIHLTCGTIEEKELYKAVDKVLQALGGKWNKKEKTHLYNNDPTSALESILETGILPPTNPTAYFPTPEPLARDLARMLTLNVYKTPLRILEPSAGTGVLAEAAQKRLVDLDVPDISAQIDVIELLPDNRTLLAAKGYHLAGHDFLSYTPEKPYDWIIMNPPFATPTMPYAWQIHLNHAWEMLAPYGQLVAILPASIQNPTNRNLRDLRMKIIRQGEIMDNPPNSFRSAKTDVQTCSIYMEKTDTSWRERPDYQDGLNWHVWTWKLCCDNDRGTYQKQWRLMDTLLTEDCQTTLVNGHLRSDIREQLLPVYNRVRETVVHDGTPLEPTPNDIQTMLDMFEDKYQDYRSYLRQSANTASKLNTNTDSIA